MGVVVYFLTDPINRILGRVHTCSGSRSGPVPLVPVAFTPAKIDRTRSGCGPVTRSHLFRNAYGYTHPPPPPPPSTGFLILGLRWSRIDGQVRRRVMCPNFGLQRNFGRCTVQTRGDSTFNDSDSSTPFRFRFRLQSSWLRFRLQHYFYERFRLRFRFNSDSITPYILIMTPELYKF